MPPTQVASAAVHSKTVGLLLLLPLFVLSFLVLGQAVYLLNHPRSKKSGEVIQNKP